MSPPLVIDTEAVRALARRLDAAAADADRLRTRLLGLLTSAVLDDAAPPGALATVDEELGLVAHVLRARATQADYPLRDTVAMALAAEVARAEADLWLVAGPDPARIADGRAAARRLSESRASPPSELLALIAASAGDPSFARGFTLELPPEAGAAVVLAASAAGPFGPYAPGSPGARDEWGLVHGRLLDALGHAYAEAARWRGSRTLSADGAEVWVRGITADPSGDGVYGQAAAMALLLAHGAFDDDVLAEIADGVYRYERVTAERSNPLWLPRSNVGDSYVGPLAPDGTRPYDPLASILAAMGDHPRAAQTFFIGGTTVDRTAGDVTFPVQERLAYLLGSRRWPTDDGAALGGALAAATTMFRDRSEAGRISAVLSSQTIAVVGAKTGGGKGGWGPWRHEGWYAPRGMRTALATIVASYMPDVFQTLQATVTEPADNWYVADNAAFPPEGPYGATFTVHDLAATIETIGTNPEDTRRLVAAVLGTERLRLGTAIDRLVAEHPDLAAAFMAGGARDVSLVQLENAVNASGQALGFVVDHGYRGLRDEQQRRAAAQRQLSELLQVAIGLPFVPMPKGPWGKVALDKVTRAIFDAWRSGTPHDAAERYGALDAAVTAELRDQVLDDLLARGLLEPDLHIDGFRPPPDGALVRRADGTPDDPPRFDRRSQAYVDWATSYAPRSWLEVQVGLFYSNAFGRVP